MPDRSEPTEPQTTFFASIHSARTDREGEVTLALKVPASDAILVAQLVALLVGRLIRVTITSASE